MSLFTLQLPADGCLLESHILVHLIIMSWVWRQLSLKYLGLALPYPFFFTWQMQSRILVEAGWETWLQPWMVVHQLTCLWMLVHSLVWRLSLETHLPSSVFAKECNGIIPSCFILLPSSLSGRRLYYVCCQTCKMAYVINLLDTTSFLRKASYKARILWQQILHPVSVLSITRSEIYHLWKKPVLDSVSTYISVPAFIVHLWLLRVRKISAKWYTK